MMSNTTVSNSALERIKTSLYEVHKMFQLFDVDHTSNISPEILISTTQFSQVLCCLGYQQDQGEMEEMLQEFDDDGGGEMNFVEFADMMTNQNPSRIQQLINDRVRELRRFFDLLDDDKGGTLTIGEMCANMKRLGRKPSDEELAEAMGSAADPNLHVSEIALDFQAFVRFIAGSGSKAQRHLQAQLREYREAFDLFDQDGGGDVSLEEMVGMLKQFGLIDINEDILEEAIMEHDVEQDGEIDFVDFMAMMVSENEIIQTTIKSHLTGFREAFNLFDESGDGDVSNDEFLETWTKLGFTTPEEQVRALLASIDEDGDGEMGFEEFVKMLTHVSEGGDNVSDVGTQIRETLQELPHAWSLLDPDGDGSICAEEMDAALSNVNEAVSMEKLEKSLAEVDDDGNGELDFSEFAMIMSVNRVKPGKLIGKAAPTVVQLKAESRASINWKRFEMITELDATNRTDEMCAELAGYLRKLGDYIFDKVSDEVLIELGKSIFVRTVAPHEIFFKEGDAANLSGFLLDGSLSCWRRKIQEEKAADAAAAATDYTGYSASDV